MDFACYSALFRAGMPATCFWASGKVMLHVGEHSTSLLEWEGRRAPSYTPKPKSATTTAVYRVSPAVPARWHVVVVGFRSDN
jgi:hypothetical protein